MSSTFHRAGGDGVRVSRRRFVQDVTAAGGLCKSEGYSFVSGWLMGLTDASLINSIYDGGFKAMKHSNRLAGIAMATPAAALFAAAQVSAAEDSGNTVKCVGVNACKGKSSCKTASSSCKGQNSSKGQGFVAVSSKDVCEQLGGKFGGKVDS